jgi:penicillin-binding protein 1A
MDTQNSTPQGTPNKERFINWVPLSITILMWLGFVTSIYLVNWYVSAVIENKDNFFGAMPTYEVLENPKSEYSSVLFSSDSIILGSYYRSNRTAVKYKDISSNMLNALLATEDVRYYEHSGIDMKGSFAILWYMVKGDKRGSSTITQQLAKNLYNTRNKAFEGELTKNNRQLKKIIDKTKEWITSVRLEKAFTKEEIITMYLNTVDFGSLSFGIQTAAKTFFGKDQKKLEVNEAAILTGVLKAPTSYSPVVHPNKSLARRNTVLKQMLVYEFLQQPEYDSLKALPLNLSYKVENHTDGSAAYFRTICSNYLNWWCKQNNYDLWADGLRIYTTIDSKMQKHAESAVRDHLTAYQQTFFDHWDGENPWVRLDTNDQFEEIPRFLENNIKRTSQYKYLKKKFKGDTIKIDLALNEKKNMRVFSWTGEIDTVFSHYDSLKYYKQFLHTGFVSMDPHSGAIKAWVGGINYKHFKYDHVRQGKRQPGSTFKPIVYATILGEAGQEYSPCYKVVDAPVTFFTGDEDKPTWTPKNSEGTYSGDTLTLRQAMARSVNSITAYMMKIMGSQTPYLVKKYARRLGITSDLAPVPAMCLGTFDVSVYEMVGAYSTFVNEGIYTKPRFIDRIEDRYGNVIKQFPRETKSAISKELAHTMTYMLRGATEEQGGTGRGLYRYDILGKDAQVGAKTGTTQNYSDGWFMGVTPNLVSGVWVGAEDRSVHFKTIKLGQGARMAMPIWALYMEKVYADTTLNYQKEMFPEPDFEVSMNFDCTNEPKKIDSTIVIIPDSLKSGIEDIYQETETITDEDEF